MVVVKLLIVLQCHISVGMSTSETSCFWFLCYLVLTILGLLNNPGNEMQFDIKYSISKAICIIKCFRKVCSNGNELALHNVLETGDLFSIRRGCLLSPPTFFLPFFTFFYDQV